VDPLRAFHQMLAFAAGGVLCAGAVQAQNLPAKPLRMIVGLAPGGSTDVTARIVGQKLAEELGQPVVIENRAGAAGAIAAQLVATAPADGSTALIVFNSHTILPVLRKDLQYHLVRDFAPVSLLALGVAVLAVHPSVPVRNVRDLVALARAHPGRLNYGSSGAGGTTHLMGELFASLSQAKFTHVPYKGSAENAIAVVGGQIEIGFLDITATLPLVRAGKLAPLAVTTLKRATLMPDLPTLDESGLRGYDYAGWNGLSVPAATPREVVARLNRAIERAVQAAETRESLVKQGMEPQTGTPEQFAAFIANAGAKNARLLAQAGLKTE
jgi:tripartite-type tricarboxylate transporter receptor subunit TctC